MHPLRRLAAPLPLLVAACVSSTAPKVAAHARWIPAVASGDVTVTRDGVASSGSRVDVADDLDVERRNQGELALDVALGGARIGASWLPLAFDGERTLDRNVTFHGANFAAGDRVKSDLELDSWCARVDWPLFAQSGTELRAGAGACGWDFRMKLDDATAATSERVSVSRVAPAVTASGLWQLQGPFSIGVDGAFATLGGGRRRWDVALLGHCALAQGFDLEAGYRYVELRLAENDEVGTLRVHGPTLGMTYRF